MMAASVEKVASFLREVAMKDRWTGSDWTITFDGSQYRVEQAGRTNTLTPSRDTPLSIRRSWFRKYLHHGQTRVVRLAGMSKQDTTSLTLAAELAAAIRWTRRFVDTVDQALRTQRWIPRETVDDLVQSQPEKWLVETLRRVDLASLLSAEEVKALAMLETDVPMHIAEVNERTRQQELRTRSAFFKQIERQPLTQEQANAVITFDNRVQVVAAAGSGKTSVMVARAAYAVSRGFVRPERVLLLAFNKDAAVELQERVQQRLTAAGIDPSGIRASTFHSFGLDVIGKATGAKPRPAPWLESGRDLVAVQEIVDHLRDTSPDFRYKWDLFRLLFANTTTTPEGGDHDHYDRETRQTGIKTFSDIAVKSHGERMIANWLHLSGVEFEYERPYSARTATADHSQYRPDFYYPQADLWHEHWALDREGNPPKSFAGYLGGIEWKRERHRENQTKLIESTWAGIVYGTGLADLARDLRTHGIEPDWNPDRPLPGAQPVRHEEISRLVRTFMTHVKSGKLDRQAVQQRLESKNRSIAGTRTSLFLDIYWPIHEAWDRRLRDEEFVDFEDMLSIAADILETGTYEAPYDLILVDEFQDASQARARLVRGLVNRPGKFLLAVGDDWQSINRFAGADISVMTDFQNWFGLGPRLELTKTFRCTQRICNVSSAFVSRNPSQINKSVQSVQTDHGRPIQLIRHESLAFALDQYLRRLSDDVSSGNVVPGPSGRVSVDVLGRYRHDRDLMPKKLPKNLHVTFRTVHGSKGLEADYVIIPNATSGTYGFPSSIADDPVMDLAMAAADGFEHAEERRLFYVALTRARRQVVILTKPGLESPFVTEISNSPDVEAVDAMGEKVEEVRVCPACKEGTLVRRTGPYGEFDGCSRFPACKGPRNDARARGSWRR